MDQLLPPLSHEGIKKQGIATRVNIRAYEPCPIHAPNPCECPKKLVGEVEKCGHKETRIAG